jgi:hypothetical protein
MRIYRAPTAPVGAAMLKFDWSSLEMRDRNEIARALAEAHRKVEPGIRRIIRVVAAKEDDSAEPVKLLEVNPETPRAGIVPISFGADPPEFPFPSVVIEVTEAELEDIRSGRLPLPHGWRLEDTLYPIAA